jgi:DNA-binding response OmpR family regulator
MDAERRMISVQAPALGGPLGQTLAHSPRILLIDDEPRILRFVSRALRAEGFSVETAADGTEGRRRALSERFDLILLDLLLPGLDGTAVLRAILAHKPDQPVIVLSALNTIRSKVDLLELGADDYVAKPFVFDELLARIRARLRNAAKDRPTQWSAGSLKLDVVRRHADRGWGSVPLAEREFLLLQELMRNAGRTVSKERLLSAVWGYHFDPGSNVVDVYVRRIRAKLGRDVITTVRGMGYRIDGG